MKRRFYPFCHAAAMLAALLLAMAAGGCSTTKYVPEGSFLLEDVSVKIVADSAGHRPQGLSPLELRNYLRQTPNYEVLGFLKLQLNTYSLSGRDTTKAVNRWLRRIGQPPVILDSALTKASAAQLQQAMVNRGYMDAVVDVQQELRPEKKKASLTYSITPGEPRVIRSIAYTAADSAMLALVRRDSARVEVQPGAIFDRDKLEEMRVYLAERLRRRGYYAFSKEYITFIADTSATSRDVDLTLVLHNPATDTAGTGAPGLPAPLRRHRLYDVRNVYFLTDWQPGETIATLLHGAASTWQRDGYIVVYGKDRYIKPGILIEKCFINPGRRYNAAAVERTYEYMGQLGIIRNTNIDFRPVAETDSTVTLDAFILLTRGKKQTISLKLEGTNSEGDLGFGVGLTYRHRNLAHEAQLLTVKFRSSYESLSGNLEGFVNKRYTEQAAEAGLTFPRFIFPFLRSSFKHTVKATSELALSFNYQERPEYTRIIAGAAWKYRWTNRRQTRRLTWDVPDINYVRLPKSTLHFIDLIAPDNPMLRYSYEDHFIMRMGFALSLTNRRGTTTGSAGADILKRARLQPSVYSVRASVETAGNFLRLLSAIIDQHRHEGAYKIFGIQYSQYAKAEVDWAYARNFTPRHSLALHASLGVGVPYGNSTAIPFERRFYAGGANGVRGWSVRTLGPGSYRGNGSAEDFMNQCGDISLVMSMEYRAKLFWLLEGALFIDGGNIWTIRNYPNQPGGLFKPGDFWREIALAYGAGLRLDFTYFIFRLDLGFKAHNPAQGEEPWPIIHPRWKRDATLHFAVGYPF